MAMMLGNDKQPAGDDAAQRAMHQPADIGRELLRLRSRQQHAIIERVQKSTFRNPMFLVDQDAVHHRNLGRRTAEAQERDLEPDPKRLVERDTVLWLRTICRCDGQLCHGYRRFFLKNS